MAGESNDAHVVTEILAAELRADSGLLRHLQELRFEFEITEALSKFVALKRKGIEVLRRCHLRGLECELG